MPIFRVKSVKIYTSQKKFTRAPLVVLVTNMRYGLDWSRLAMPAWSSVSCSQLSFVQAANIASRYKWKDTRGVFKGHCKQGAADLFAKEDKLIWLAATRCPLKVIESLDPTALKNNEELSIWYLIWDGGGIVYCPTQPSCIAHFDLCQLSYLGVGDTLSDSIQCLNFAETWFNSIFVSISLTQNSIQTIIQFKTNSTDLIQKILQFNSQGIIDTDQIRKVPKKRPK